MVAVGKTKETIKIIVQFSLKNFSLEPGPVASLSDAADLNFLNKLKTN